MSEYIDLNAIAIVYEGEFLANVPNTYKAFLECLRDKVGLSNENFAKRTIWCGDFPLMNRNDYIRLLKKKGVEGIFQIDLVENEDDENLFGENDYIKYLDNQEQEEEIKIKIKEDEPQAEAEAKEEKIFIKSEVNEFYAITKVTQNYKNNNSVPIELNIYIPIKKRNKFQKIYN